MCVHCVWHICTSCVRMCACPGAHPHVWLVTSKAWMADGACNGACSRCPVCRWIVGSHVHISRMELQNQVNCWQAGRLAGGGWVDGRPVAQALSLGPATTRPGPDVGLACGLRSADERKDGDLAWGLGAWGMEMGEGVLPPIGGREHWLQVQGPGPSAKVQGPCPGPALEPRPRGQTRHRQR